MSSSMQGITSLKAILMMNKLTRVAAMGSRIYHLGPSRIAPPIPTATPIEERESLLWCQALALSACDCIFLATKAVYW